MVERHPKEGLVGQPEDEEVGGRGERRKAPETVAISTEDMGLAVEFAAVAYWRRTLVIEGGRRRAAAKAAEEEMAMVRVVQVKSSVEKIRKRKKRHTWTVYN
ncbi:hypothetical protein Fmac_019267 [Flemingia macrophylla]|uniref:Uncharacterized protein n=1 Tax=Flemingia macrophylla TaxID=520843 RepID=A0ABD1M7C2_9FABA